MPSLPPDRRSITGLVLAGGRGARMGGADKGLVAFRGRPLVAHVLARLAPQVGPLVIAANRNANAYAALGPRVVQDDDEARHGPLAGVAAGLAVADTDWLVAVPCDAPFVPHDLVTRLADGFDATAVVLAHARAGGRDHGVFCLMRTDVAPSPADFLARGGRSVHRWIADVGGVAVDFDDAHAFRNLNTPDDLARAEREFE